MEFIKGLAEFLNSTKTIINFLYNIIGLRAILLFIAASLIGNGLSFWGIPRGKASFFLSLLIADIFWFIGIKSFNNSFDLVNMTFSILKTNLILIIPFIIIYIFKTSIISKRVLPKILSLIKLPFKKKKSVNKIIEIVEKLQETNMQLQKSLFKDIINQKDKSNVVLSPDTLKWKKELEEVIKKFERD